MLLDSSLVAHHLNKLFAPILNKWGSSHTYCFESQRNFFFWCQFMSSRITPTTLKFAKSANHGLSYTNNSFSSENSSRISISSVATSSFTSLDKWFATWFSLPFLSWISRSNSWNNKIHLMSLGLESGLVNKYLITTWSMYRTTFGPIKYKQIFSKAYTIASNSFSVVP